jgi:two-component system, OmpR family, response regulator
MDPVVGICEDDHGLRGALVRALESEGYAIRTASTGHEAMASFGNGNVDALILDIGLPDADGRDVCQALRAHGVEAPGCSSPPATPSSTGSPASAPAATTT